MSRSNKALSILLCFTVFFSMLVPLYAHAGEERTSAPETSEVSTETTELTTVPETKPSTTKPATTKPVTTKPAPPKETKIRGLNRKLNFSKNERAAVTMKVSPANPGRIVKLQRYSSKKKKFYTVKTYKTQKADTASLTIVFPKKYRQKTIGKWRVVVEKSANAKRRVGKTITLTTSNVENLGLTAKAACIYCVDSKQVLYNKKMHQRRSQASCTKVMTAVLVIENGKFDKNTKVTYEAANCEFGSLNMRMGDVYRNRDLMHAMILPSANDAAMLLADSVAGSRKEFAKLMNKKARKLKLTDTHFQNPYGGTRDNHYTSAYDLSKLTGYASRHEEFMSVIARSHYSFSTVRYGTSYSFGTADKMKYYDGHLGGKTGFSEDAGACFTGLFKYKGKLYAVTILGAPTKVKRWGDMKKLYQYIEKYARQKY